jgi:hypothetical protein
MENLKKKNSENIKSRIKNFGEVFTSKNEILGMLKMVENETYRLDSTYLETACGDGNFLASILEKKFDIIKKDKDLNEYSIFKKVFISISSLYGIDLLPDNVHQTKIRLSDLSKKFLDNKLKEQYNKSFLKSLEFLLSLNIIAGDALSLKNLQNKPIVFSQWSFLQGGLVKRSDYKFSNLISYRPFEEGTLFSDMGEKVFIPDPVKDHKPVYFMDLEE